MRALILFALLAAHACAAPFDVAGRATALALVAADNNDAAVEAYKAIIAADGRFAFDRINLAIAHLKKSENKEALAALDEAVKLQPAYSQIQYLRGLALKRLRQYPDALKAFGEALKAAPDCREANFQLGLVHEYENRNAEATAAFKKLLEHTPEQARRQSIAHGQAMYLAYKHLSLVAMAQNQDAEAEKYTDEAQKYGANSPPQEQALDLGPCASLVDLDVPLAQAELSKAGVALTACKTPELKLEIVPWLTPGKISPQSVVPVSWTTAGLTGWWAGADSLIKDGTGWKNGPNPGSGRPLAAGDVNGDGHEDIVVATEAGGVEVRPFPSEGFAPVALAGVTGVTAAIATDHDHDGDLDVVVAGLMGDKPGLWNFQNTTKPGGSAGPVLALTSHQECGVTTDVAGEVAALAAGDLDEANDTDLLAFVKDGPPFALLSRRQGRFDRAAIKGPDGTGPGVLADLTGDGFLDLAYPTATGFAVLTGRGDGTFMEAREVPLPGGLRTLQAADLDGDTRLDLIGVGDAQVLNIMIATADPGFTPPLAAYAKEKTGLRPMIVDLDGDGGTDIVCTGGRILMNRSAKDAGFVKLSLTASGGLSNGRGVGSRLWVRVGGRVIRREVTHAAELFNLGGCPQADLVRIQWTNGVLQHVLRDSGKGKSTVIEAGGALDLSQPAGLSGSCPYLYVDKGHGPEYLTDVLAGAPLGLPGPDGKLVPSSPRELVGIPRAAWAPVRGAYRMRVTEEYREVTYLDQVRLWVVDHPANTVALADGGIGAPADAARVLLADRLEPVTRALDSAGHDVTATLAQADGQHLEPPRGAVQGLAPEHALELTLPASGASRWLVLTGFVYWTDAGLNTRLAQVDRDLLKPPRLEVRDAQGAWRVALPFVRFPAGRSKTALVDLSNVLGPNDRTVRLVTSMRIYLDQVAVASAAAIVSARPRMLTAKTADLVHHGIAPLGPDADRPPWSLDATRRRGSLDGSWLVPAGFYTRFGPVGPLLADFDDRYAVIGPGDGVDLAFDIPAGPAAGLERDLFLECAGWDKDAHPATFASSTVEPLPYRGMPEYGPRGVVDAKRQAELKKSMAEFNTRWRQGIGGSQP